VIICGFECVSVLNVCHSSAVLTVYVPGCVIVYSTSTGFVVILYWVCTLVFLLFVFCIQSVVVLSRSLKDTLCVLNWMMTTLKWSITVPCVYTIVSRPAPFVVSFQVAVSVSILSSPIRLSIIWFTAAAHRCCYFVNKSQTGLDFVCSLLAVLCSSLWFHVVLTSILCVCVLNN